MFGKITFMFQTIPNHSEAPTSQSFFPAFPMEQSHGKVNCFMIHNCSIHFPAFFKAFSPDVPMEKSWKIPWKSGKIPWCSQVFPWTFQEIPWKKYEKIWKIHKNPMEKSPGRSGSSSPSSRRAPSGAAPPAPARREYPGTRPRPAAGCLWPVKWPWKVVKSPKSMGKHGKSRKIWKNLGKKWHRISPETEGLKPQRLGFWPSRLHQTNHLIGEILVIWWHL